MTDEYKRNYLKEVILRIDFPDASLKLEDGVPTSITKKILIHYPIPEKSDLIEKSIKISGSADEKPVEVIKEYTQWAYHGKNRDKNFCISNDYAYFSHKTWDSESYKQVEELCLSLLDELFDINPELQVTRLGFRYINHIESHKPGSPIDWGDYLNNDMLCIFNIAADHRQYISRAFHNLVLNYGDVMLRFQYGMHNPDYPATIRKKLFVLDYDAYCEGPQNKQEIETNLKCIHDKIIEFFELSILDNLRAIMREVDSGEQ